MSVSEEDDGLDFLTSLPGAIREFTAAHRQRGDIFKEE